MMHYAITPSTRNASKSLRHHDVITTLMYVCLGELGLDEVSTRINSKANSGAGLHDTSTYSYKRSGMIHLLLLLP